MSTQQDIYATGSESRPPMLNKENYVPWSSRLLRYAKSRPNGKLIHNSILNGPYVRKMIHEPGDANRDITTILLSLHEDIYAAVDSCETAQEIWLRVQQMMKGSDIGIQEKKAKLFNECEKFISNEGESTESYSHPDYTQLYDFLKYNQKEIAQPGMNMGRDRQIQMVGGNGNQNQIGNGNLVAARAEGNAAGQNGNQIRCYNCRGVGHYVRNCTVRPRRRDAAYLQTQLFIAQKEEAGIQLQAEDANCILMANLQQASTSGIQLQAEEFDLMAATADLDEIEEVNANFSDDNTPSVARKFLNEVKSTIVTLQRVVKHRMTLETHNWPSSAHQKLHKIVKDENFPIVNQVDARVQNFEIQFLKEVAKFVGDFKSLAKEADESLAKHKALELEIEHLLRAVHKKYDECKFDKISYDNAYKDMQQKIERLQAHLGDLKGKSKDTSCVSETINPLSQKLENENVELKFQVLNYAKENAHLKTTYKNLLDSISVSRTQTKTIIASLQNELQNMIYENAKLRAQLFKKVSVQKDNTCGTSTNTKFEKQSILGKPPMLGEIHALSKPVTLNSIPTPQESKVVKNDKVIAPGMFRIIPFKTSREEKHVPNNVRASARTKPITVSQPPVIIKKDVNSDSNGLSSIRIDNTKTRRP
nr:hypothetical protein [Tanacetum cinerariifolium]